MDDAVKLVWDLGKVAEDAALRGDDRAAAVIQAATKRLMDLEAIVGSLERRRAKDRERKPVANPRIPRKSTESAESHSAPSVFPHTPFPTPPETQHNTAREANEDGLAQTYSGLLSTAMGDGLFPDADAFVRRRPFETWRGWFREMLSLIGPGSQYVAADLAQVCRDDTTLDRRIASPKGLRIFLASARQERISAGNGTAHPSSDHAEAQRLVATIREFVLVSQSPAQAPVRYIPQSSVEGLGAKVFRAYKDVGGAERFLSVTGDKLSFLVRDFAAALNQPMQASV